MKNLDEIFRHQLSKYSVNATRNFRQQRFTEAEINSSIKTMKRGFVHYSCTNSLTYKSCVKPVAAGYIKHDWEPHEKPQTRSCHLFLIYARNASPPIVHHARLTHTYSKLPLTSIPLARISNDRRLRVNRKKIPQKRFLFAIFTCFVQQYAFSHACLDIRSEEKRQIPIEAATF